MKHGHDPDAPVGVGTVSKLIPAMSLVFVHALEHGLKNGAEIEIGPVDQATSATITDLALEDGTPVEEVTAGQVFRFTYSRLPVDEIFETGAQVILIKQGSGEMPKQPDPLVEEESAPGHPGW